MREVIIDKTFRLDMAQEDYAGIVFNNPIFYDLSQMKANRTTTFKIPLTNRNNRYLSGIGSPDAVTTFPRALHTIDEYRDGLHIIRNGQAVLLRIADGFAEFSVTWGVLKPIQELLKINLNELQEVPPILWTGGTGFMQPGDNTDYGFLKMKTFQGGPVPNELRSDYHFPSVNILWLFNKIAAETGVTFVYDTPISTMLGEMYVNLTTKKAAPGYMPKINIAALYQTSTLQRAGFTVSNDPLDMFVPFGPSTPNIYMFRPKVGTYTFKINYQFVGDGTRRYNILAVNWIIRTPGRPDETIGSGWPISGNSFSIDYEETVRILNFDNVDSRADIYLKVYGDNTEFRGVTAGQPDADYGIQSLQLNLQITKTDEDIVYPEPFPIVANLPEMTAMDFIKSIMFHRGLYVRPDGSNTLRFGVIDDLAAGIKNPVVLDRRIINRESQELSYTFSDYAQRNTFEFAEDDYITNPEDYNGSIDIWDMTLESVREMVAIEFAPSAQTVVDSDDVAELPLFENTVENDEAVIDFIGNNLSPRFVQSVLTNQGITGRVYKGVFPDSWKFSNVIAERYRLLSAMLKNPKVVRENVYMSNAELHKFSETDVFYFRGQYWMLVQGTVTNNVMSGEFINLPVTNLTNG